MQKYYLAFAVIAVICVGALIWQYALSRDAVSDQQKVADITSIQSALDSYASGRGDVPDNLKDLKLDANLASRLADYEYNRGADSYTICANFKTDASLPGSSFDSLESDVNYHKKGRQCFTSDIFSYDFGNYNFDELYNTPNGTSPYDSFNFDSLYQ
ncbi:MAG: hypothetical protein ACREGD_02350 [Candidatus Saccharimonadales bacterium]